MTNLLSTHGRATRRPRAVGPFSIARAGGSKDREARPIGAFVLGIGTVLALALLTVLSMGSPARAAFPGQNGRIACDGARRGPASPSAEVFTMDPDGGAVRVLTDNTADDIDPAWSPDGTKLSFDSLRDSSALDIYTMNPDGTGIRRLTFAPAEDRRTSWSPDGRIAFQAGRDGNFNIYTMNGSDGSDQRGLTVDPTQDTQPAWSPDGSKIAYRSSRQGNVGGDIFTMDANVGESKDLKNVTNSPGVGDFAPNYSPDGRQIAFQSTLANGTLAIFRMNADGTGPATFLTTVTNEPGKRFSNNESNPAWSPDGTRIVFHSDRDRDPNATDPGLRDNVEVYTMNAADGSGVTRLTNSPGFDGRCDWGRVPPPPPAGPGPATGSSSGGLTSTGTTGFDTTAPGVRRFGVLNNPFAVSGAKTPTFGFSAAKKHRKGTAFTYTLSEAATVRIVITQRRSGRRKGIRCVAPRRSLRKKAKCTMITRKGTLTRISKLGVNRVAFSGRIGSKALTPGTYSATITATDAAKNRSGPKTISFKIVKR